MLCVLGGVGLAGQDGDTLCDRPEPLRIRWSLTLLGRTRSSGFSISGHSAELERLQVVRDGFAWGRGSRGVRGSLSERDEDTALLHLHGCCQPTKLKHNCWTRAGSDQGKCFQSPMGVNLEP